MADGIEDALRALAAHRPLGRAVAKALSGLASGQAARFKEVWSQLPDPERLHTLARLRKLATDNVLLDFDAIFLVAMDDPNADVRRVAVASSISDENEAVLSKLLGLASADPDEMVRAAAAERLGGFAYEAEVGKLSEEARLAIQDALLGLVRSEAEATHVRAAALASVGVVSTEVVRAEIRGALRQPALQVAGIRAMARNLDPEWTATIQEQMLDEDPVVRREAAIAASEYEGTVEALGNLVDDPDMSVRLAAISSLGRIGGPEAYELLVYCHESSDPAIREAATRALEELESDDDLDDFSALEPGRE